MREDGNVIIGIMEFRLFWFCIFDFNFIEFCFFIVKLRYNIKY